MIRLLNKKMSLLVLLFLLIIITGWRAFSIVDAYAPNIYFWDRWRTMEPVFNNLGFFEGFAFQHGQHRLGLIYWLFEINAHFSNFSGRADMFLQAALYVVAALFGLKLKYKLFQCLKWTDVIIPLVFLTPAAAETYTGSPYVHGLVPVMALGFAYLYTIKVSIFRSIVITFFMVIAAFSGFAMVVVVAVVAVQLLASVQYPEGRYRELGVALIGCATLLLIYATNTPGEPIAGYALSLGEVYQYSVVLLCDLFIVSTTLKDIVIASILLLSASVLAVRHINGSFEITLTAGHYSIITLLGSSLVFTVFNILGRAHMGIDNALADRYIPVGMCFGLGLYFLILTVPERWTRVGGSIILFSLLVRVHIHSSGPLNKIKNRYYEIKEWEVCLKKTGQFNSCVEQVSNKNALHPNPLKGEIQGKLDFLRENNLNIYKD